MAGRQYLAPYNDKGSDGGLQEVRQHVESEGQRFQWQIITQLFNSELSGAVR